MFNNKVFRVNAILFLAFGLLMFVFGLTGTGAAALLLAIGNLFMTMVSFLDKQKTTAKTQLLCAGIFLLIGFSLCSVSPGIG